MINIKSHQDLLERDRYFYQTLFLYFPLPWRWWHHLETLYSDQTHQGPESTHSPGLKAVSRVKPTSAPPKSPKLFPIQVLGRLNVASLQCPRMSWWTQRGKATGNHNLSLQVVNACSTFKET